MRNFRFPIAFKLVGITASLLLAVTSLIALRSSRYFEREVRQTHEQSNQMQAVSRATEVEGLLQGYVDKLRMVASLMYKPHASVEEKEEAIKISFRADRDLVSVEIYEMKDGRPVLVERIINEEYLRANGFGPDYIDNLRKQRSFPVAAVFAGQIEIVNSSIRGGLPLITVGIPFVKNANDEFSHIAVADIRLDRIQKTFSSVGAAEIFLVDKNGNVLAHPNDRLALEAVSLKDNPLVEASISSKFRSNHLPSFQYGDKVYYGVYNRTPFGVSVIAQIPEEVILEPAVQVRRQAFYVGGLVLSCALFLIFLFSITLTRPIERLLELTKEVALGNFDVDASSKIRSKDEVNDLAVAFDRMTAGLKALVRTQGADVAQTLMESDLENLGGTKKDVAVLFSDLRNFTRFSEGHTPEEVVEMLNEYFEIMVGCIERNQGRVNKFIGDAIMAMWGAPSSTGNDEVLAVRAALEMRTELAKLNELRFSRGQGPITIGIGIHCGEAVAGTIGSKSRLEYTIIGDTVNQASRLEASTKAFGVDLLISQEMYEKVKDAFIIELAGTAEVKGKSEPLKMYRVRGYIDENGQPVIVQTPYSEYQAEAADKVKIAS